MVVGPDAELIDEEELRRQVDAHAAIQAVLRLRPAEIPEQVLGADEVHAEALLNRAEAESHREDASSPRRAAPARGCWRPR